MFSAFKLLHAPTGVECCAAAYLTDPHPLNDMQHSGTPENGTHNLPNLVVTKGNVLEVYTLRTVKRKQMEESETSTSEAWLELACEYRLHANVESIAVVEAKRDGGNVLKDALLLVFRDLKASVLTYDEATHGLITSSMHYYEGKEWEHLKGGQEKFPRGPVARQDPAGRCCGVLAFGRHILVLLTTQGGRSVVDEDGLEVEEEALSASIESSYVADLHEFYKIKDFVFLSDCLKPTVVLLHEVDNTWSGRVALKKFTCAVTAIALDTALQQHSTVWSAPLALSYDAYKLLSVPAPIGGALVLTASTIHYLSQNTTAVLAVNEYASSADDSMELPRATEVVELDAAHATWVTPSDVLLSTKTGALLLLSLLHSESGAVVLELKQQAKSILTSCMCTLGTSYFFLGSRLGDSTLVRFCTSTLSATPFPVAEGGEGLGVDPPHSKRLKGDVTEEAGELSSLQEGTASVPQTLRMHACDSLINIGPIRDFAYAPRLAAEDENNGNFHEVVACSGHGKNGALSILHRSLFTHVETQVDLPGANNVWTLYHIPGRELPQEPRSRLGNGEGDEFHAYVLIGLHSCTRVLDESLEEVTDSVEYFTQGPTLAAGNLFNRRLVAQVYGGGVRVLDGGRMIQELGLPPSSSTNANVLHIVSAAICDPFIVLKLTDGSLHLVTGDPGSSLIAMTELLVPNIATDVVTAFTLYHDRAPRRWLLTATRKSASNLPQGPASDGGDVLCIVCRESGRLEMYMLPGMTLVYAVDNFVIGRQVICDSHPQFEGQHITPEDGEDVKMEDAEEGAATAVAAGEEEAKGKVKVRVEQVCMEAWEDEHGQAGRVDSGGIPFLLASTSNGCCILCYSAFSFSANGLPQSQDDEPRLRGLRFKKVATQWMPPAEEKENAGPEDIHRRFVSFANIKGTGGAFLSGSRPLWILALRHRLRLLPQFREDGKPIAAFAPLHIPSCQHGFVFITSEGTFKICTLLPHFQLDNDWPVRKIPLCATPHQIAYCSEAKLYALTTSQMERRAASEVVVSMAGEHIPLLQGHPMHDRDGKGAFEELMPGDVPPQLLVPTEAFHIRIVAPQLDWKILHSLPLHPTEHALCLKEVRIKNWGRNSQLESLLAVGTGYVAGEDVSCKGRILLLRIHYNTAHPPYSVEEVYARELGPSKGAVSAIAVLQGNLVIAVGTRILLHKWNGKDLHAVGLFIDTEPIHVVSLTTVKNYVLVGDVMKSIYFLQWKDSDQSMTLLGKDLGHLETFATEFLIDDKTLLLVASDADKNIQTYLYKRGRMDTLVVEKLQVRGRFHVGAHVPKMMQLPMVATTSAQPMTTTTTPRGGGAGRNALLFPTLDGSIATLAHLDEVSFKRLQALQRRMVDAVPHLGGLNPAAFRAFQHCGPHPDIGPHTILDCELLSQYMMADMDEQQRLAKEARTSRDKIIKNLFDITVATTFT